MRAALWFLALFGVAVAAALFAGNNQGTVTLFWPPYRIDLSLNLVVLSLTTGFCHGVRCPARLGRPAGAAPPGTTLAPAAKRTRHARRSARCPGAVAGGSVFAFTQGSIDRAGAGKRPAARQRHRTPWQPAAHPGAHGGGRNIARTARSQPARTPPEPGPGPRCRAPQHAGPGAARRRAHARSALVAGRPRCRRCAGTPGQPAPGRRTAHAGAAHQTQGGAPGGPDTRTHWIPPACWASTARSRPPRRKASCVAWPPNSSTTPTTRPSCRRPGSRSKPASARCRNWPFMRPSGWPCWAAMHEQVRQWLLPVWQQMVELPDSLAEHHALRTGPGAGSRSG